MSRPSNGIETFLDSLRKETELQSLHYTNKTAAIAKVLGTKDSLPSTHIESDIYMGTCSSDPPLISEVLSDYFASSMTPDDNTITPVISAVSSTSPLRFFFHPSDIKPAVKNKIAFPRWTGRPSAPFNFVQYI